MCGIAGIINFAEPLGAGLIETMTQTLRHRGPDDEGFIAFDTRKSKIKPVSLGGAETKVRTDFALKKFLTQANLYLGHRRLAILDLSPGGHQPMPYGGSLWIVFNGEIYNYIELRQELRAAGYQFKTESDTEVILAAYDYWGDACVKRFNGDWAFCILDLKRHSLFLSRDRYGIKPLYYIRHGQFFAFASEIKALLTLPFVEQRLNVEKALHYLFLFSLDHTEETFFSGVHQLKPGHNLVLDLRTGEAKIQSYYVLSYSPELGNYNHKKARDYADNIRDLLFDSVRLRLRADVPIGTCLSGGLDSSSIVAIAAKQLGKDGGYPTQKTFTATFPSETTDESRFAKIVTCHTGARSHWVYPSQNRCSLDLPAILNCQDEPFGGAAIYAQWEVMREASRHVKVVLDGQGGDEVFAGYRDYRLSFLAHLLAKGCLGKLVRELWCGAKVSRSPRQTFAELCLAPFFNCSSGLQYKIYLRRYKEHFALAAQQLRLEEPARPLLEEHIGKKYTANANELLFHYFSTYSLPHLLRYEDRNSMAHSDRSQSTIHGFSSWSTTSFRFPPLTKFTEDGPNGCFD